MARHSLKTSFHPYKKNNHSDYIFKCSHNKLITSAPIQNRIIKNNFYNLPKKNIIQLLERQTWRIRWEQITQEDLKAIHWLLENNPKAAENFVRPKDNLSYLMTYNFSINCSTLNQYAFEKLSEFLMQKTDISKKIAANITEIKLPNYITDKKLKPLLDCLTGLKRIDLEGCTKLTNAILASLAVKKLDFYYLKGTHLHLNSFEILKKMCQSIENKANIKNNKITTKRKSSIPSPFHFGHTEINIGQIGIFWN